MSEDGYDDESTDDNHEEILKSPANEALERLRARERPTEEDVRLGEPFYQKLADEESIPFLIVEGGLILGSNGILYPDRLGGRHVRKILQADGRTFRQDRKISAIDLDSEGWVGSGGMLYSPDPQAYFEGHDDGDGYEWETTNQQAGYEEVFTRKDMRLYLAEIKRLEDQGATVDTNEELAFYKKELGLNTYQGRIKSADPEGEKKRQTVFHDVRNFYKMLEGEDHGNDESRIIAAHFRKHIKTRRDCWYTGKWIWRFS